MLIALLEKKQRYQRSTHFVKKIINTISAHKVLDLSLQKSLR